MLLQTAFKLKIVSVIIGLVNVLLTTQSYYQTESVFEVFAMATVILMFAISVMYLSAVHYLGKSYTLTVRKCDAAIHFVMAFITFSVSVVFLLYIQFESSKLCEAHQKEKDCITYQAIRIVLGIMSVINSVLYGIICYLLLSDNNEYEMI